MIFDCDGVLIDSETIAHDLEIAHLRGIGLDYDENEFRRRFQGLAVREWRAGLNDDHLARFGKPMPDGFIEGLSAAITHGILGNIRPIDGSLAAVRAAKLAKAVASSSPRHELVKKIAGLGLTDDFHPHIYAGDDVPRGKPAPDLFLHSAKQLQLDPRHCLVIEDSIHGVAAGISAGMTVWGFVGGPHCTPDQAERLTGAGAVRTFRHMNDLARELAILS